MIVSRFDRDYSRRKFLAEARSGLFSAGVLAPLSTVIAAIGDVSKAYPDELLSIEVYTKGRIKPGDEITSSNVEAVRDLLDPVRYEQIAKNGRRLRMAKTTTDVMRLSPWEYIEATLRNAGKAGFDARGNVINQVDGQPWIGGNPFPNPKSAVEIFAAQTLSWGRHDASTYALKVEAVDVGGDVRYSYTGGWVEMSPVARVAMNPKPYWPEHKDKLRFQSVFFLSPQAFRGTSFLNIWDYDHSAFPRLYGYVPEFRRIRQLPTDQRFEPLVPGTTLFLSDAWAAGDPLHTWGDYQIVGRGPFLAGVSGGWNANHPNWEHKTHGGPRGRTYWDTTVEMVPEAVIVEAKPVKFPRAPVSKKRAWFDVRNHTVVGYMTYDRRGEPYRSFDGSYALYESGDKRVLDGQHSYWSWAHVTASDIQTGGVTRLEQVKEIGAIVKSGANDPACYDTFLTQTALIRMGTV